MNLFTARPAPTSAPTPALTPTPTTPGSKYCIHSSLKVITAKQIEIYTNELVNVSFSLG